MTSGGLSSVGPPGAPRGGGTTSIDDFSKIVQDHWAPVYRFLDCSMGNAHDAEDLTQETFLRAWSRLDSFRPGTNLRAWLLRIAANAALDVHRRRGRVGFVPLDRDPIGAADSPGHGLETAERDALRDERDRYHVAFKRVQGAFTDYGGSIICIPDEPMQVWERVKELGEERDRALGAARMEREYPGASVRPTA